MTPNSSAQRGAALVELALTLPLLLVLLFAAADFARIYYVATELTDAARAGTQFGAKSLGTSTDTAGMAAAANAAVNVSLGSVTPLPLCYCALDAGTAMSSASCASGTTCASGSHHTVWVKVTVTKVFSPVTRIPGIPASITLTRSAMQRVLN